MPGVALSAADRPGGAPARGVGARGCGRRPARRPAAAARPPAPPPPSERPVGVAGQSDVDVRGVHATSFWLLDRGSLRRRPDVGSPSSNRSVKPLELVAPPGVVGARQAAQLDVHRTGPRAGGVSRTQTRRRRTTSDTSSPAIIVIANTSTQTWPGSWETCRLTNGTAPSKRTTVPAPGPWSIRTCSPARRLTRLPLGQPALLDQPRVQGEQRLRPPGVQAGVAAVDVDGDRRVVERGKARRQQGAVELLGRREQALDRDLVLAALVGVGIAAGRRVDARHARRQQRAAGRRVATARSRCGSARRGRSP